jgi:DNA-binding HxlR family transcriptional regulator
MSPRKSKPYNTQCPVELTLQVIDGRWKVLILRHLLPGPCRFNQLLRALNGITQRALTTELREMEADGVIYREVFKEIPPRVEYSLTSWGETLKPLIDEMHDWGLRCQRRLQEK